MFIIKDSKYPASHISAYGLEWAYDHTSYMDEYISYCVLFIPLRGYHCD